jgi:hypothetical protein
VDCGLLGCEAVQVVTIVLEERIVFNLNLKMETI